MISLYCASKKLGVPEPMDLPMKLITKAFHYMLVVNNYHTREGGARLNRLGGDFWRDKVITLGLSVKNLVTHFQRQLIHS